MGLMIKHNKGPICVTHSRLGENISLMREDGDFQKYYLSILAQARILFAKLTFFALLCILRPSSFLFLAQIIPFSSQSPFFLRNLQLTPNLGIKCFYSIKDHKKYKKI